MATKKRGNRLIWILVGLIALLSVFAIWKNKNNPKGERVTVEKVQKRTIKETVSASGKIFPETEVKISSDVSGQVVELYVEEGDTVKQGQLLARIDPDSYESAVERGSASVNNAKAQRSQILSQIESTRAQSAQVRAQLSNAKAVFERTEKLFKEGVASQADYDSALAQLRTQESNLMANEANIRSGEESAKAADFGIQSSLASLKELKTSLRRTSLYAPINGIVSKKSIEKGERVVGTIQMSGTEVMRIANMNVIEVQVDVSENDIPRVSRGDETDIEVDAYIGRKFKGRITEIANSSNAAATTTLNSDQVSNFVVKIRIDPSSYSDLIQKGKPHPFRPGMSASVEINTNTLENVLSLPIQAVTTREDKPKEGDKKGGNTENTEKKASEFKEVVFVAVGDSVKIVNVKTGIQDDNFIYISSGLTENDEVVIAPYDAISKKLKSGEKIIKVAEKDLYAVKKK